MASFRCYDNSDVIATLITTNFHLYLIQLWWQFFQMFVYGDAGSLCSNLAGIDSEKLYRAIFKYQYGLCCFIGPRFCSTVLQKFEQLAKIFWANGLPPPWQKITRTPMERNNFTVTLKTYTCIVLTDVQHTRLYPFQP